MAEVFPVERTKSFYGTLERSVSFSANVSLRQRKGLCPSRDSLTRVGTGDMWQLRFRAVVLKVSSLCFCHFWSLPPNTTFLAPWGGLNETPPVSLGHLNTWFPVDGCLGRIRRCGPGGRALSLRASLRFQRPLSSQCTVHLPPTCGFEMWDLGSPCHQDFAPLSWILIHQNLKPNEILFFFLSYLGHGVLPLWKATNKTLAFLLANKKWQRVCAVPAPWAESPTR